MNSELALKRESSEEFLNTLSHTIGFFLGIAGLIFLLVRSEDPVRSIAFLIYGSTQILLYLSSAATHMFSNRPDVHKVIRVFDQSAIYLFIAGTFTPVALIILPEPYRTRMLVLVWVLAFLGVIMKSVFIQKKHILSDLLYLPMGWMVVFFLKPLIEYAPKGFFLSLIGGAVFYTLGIVFYITKKVPYSHFIWHLFVIAGSLSFYLGFVTTLL